MTNPENRPLVSVVMASRNGERFLLAQVESILGQTIQDIELIISDDHSDDSTPALIASLAEKDSRVRYFMHQEQKGLNGNFEFACRQAKGSFIAISDQDDVWREDKLEKLLSLFKEDIVLCHGQSIRFTDKIPFEARTYDKRIPFRGSDSRKLFYFNTIAGHNIMFRHELLTKALPFPGNVYYDWWICMIAACNGKLEASGEVLTYHRFHASNVTLGKKDEKLQTREKALERLEAAQAFLQIPQMDEYSRRFGEKLLLRLEQLRLRKFSLRLFFFLLSHAGTVFFFKKSFFPFISHLKISYRLAWAK